jgi:hypothetical protein
VSPSLHPRMVKTFRRWYWCILYLQVWFSVEPVESFVPQSRQRTASPGSLLLAVPQLPGKSKSVEEEMVHLERQVMDSAKEKMDYNQLKRALEYPEDSQLTTSPPSTWRISLAAASATSIASLFLFGSVSVSVFVLATIFIVASADPLQDDSLLGALARLLGRATLQSYEASQPKVKALARAVVTGNDELGDLRLRLKSLEKQNKDLRKWKKRRLYVETNLHQYSLDELRQQARLHGIPIGGTKLELLQRLVDAGVPTNQNKRTVR